MCCSCFLTVDSACTNFTYKLCRRMCCAGWLVFRNRMWISHWALGSSWDFISVCYGSLLLLSDLTPTIGVWQPVFVALFPRYRSLFLVLVHGHVVSYLIPLGLRFRCGHPCRPCRTAAAYYCAHIQLLSRKLSRARCLHVLHRCLQAPTPFHGVAYRPVDIFPQNVRLSPSRLSTPVGRAAVALICLFGLRTRIRWPP